MLAVTLFSLLASNDVGVKFLEENAKKEGVISLPSGLQYKVLRAGDGDSHPTASSSCECHYEGRTAQEYSKEPKGDTFDSSYARGSPTSFAPNQVIKGWTEAMQLMVEGDKWEMYIPSELGYGDSGSPPKIGGGDVLVFTMEIIKIKGAIKIAPPTRLSIGRAGLWLQLALGMLRSIFQPGPPRRPAGEKVPASKCDVKSLDGCTEQEAKYASSKKSLDGDGIAAEMKRLQGIAGQKMGPKQASWLAKRLSLLTKLKDEL